MDGFLILSVLWLRLWLWHLGCLWHWSFHCYSSSAFLLSLSLQTGSLTHLNDSCLTTLTYVRILLGRSEGQSELPEETFCSLILGHCIHVLLFNLSLTLTALSAQWNGAEKSASLWQMSEELNPCGPFRMVFILELDFKHVSEVETCADWPPPPLKLLEPHSCQNKLLMLHHLCVNRWMSFTRASRLCQDPKRTSITSDTWCSW